MTVRLFFIQKFLLGLILVPIALYPSSTLDTIPVTSDPDTNYKAWYADSTKTSLYCVECSRLEDLNPALKYLSIVARRCKLSNKLKRLQDLQELLIDARKYSLDTSGLVLPTLRNLALFTKNQTRIPDWITRQPQLEILTLLDSLSFLRISSWKKSTVKKLPQALGDNTSITTLIIPITLNRECLEVLSKMKSLRYLQVSALSEDIALNRLAKALGHLDGFYVESLKGKSRLGKLRLTPPNKWKVGDE